MAFISRSLFNSCESVGPMSPPLENINCCRTPMTLAEMFNDEWDPSFKATFINQCKSDKVSDKVTSLVHLPDHQLPGPANNYSVSNYTLEHILSLGIKHGFEYAEAAIAQLLINIPKPLRSSYRTKLLNRAQLLVKKKRQLPLCAFCRNNGQPEQIYMSHVLKDDYGRVVCPILRAYTCPYCQASGDYAHTINYCPLKNNAFAKLMH